MCPAHQSLQSPLPSAECIPSLVSEPVTVTDPNIMCRVCYYSTFRGQNFTKTISIAERNPMFRSHHGLQSLSPFADPGSRLSTLRVFKQLLLCTFSKHRHGERQKGMEPERGREREERKKRKEEGREGKEQQRNLYSFNKTLMGLGLCWVS